MNESGQFGENFAVDFLQKKGYKILERNYSKRCGEIDIIAANQTYIVFVEVKTRTLDYQVSPFEAVTKSKQQKIIKTALLYLQLHPTTLQPRFDVAGIYLNPLTKEVDSVQYLENAFSGGGYY